ncbi:hypothetical protein CLCR_04948 [Cladophialophora carrionii]|uniref:Uncharacterized protein n=1 Tax=Cladophialophora carrionii TaxID=86049 RepID=A0A1C1CL57_9EURO|nr:hypothetical protein CLCR_04948 [Cladophialophora carrionii]
MPAVRSFFALSILAACLAQASAGGDGGSGGFGGGGQYGGGQGGGSWDGQGQGRGDGSWGGNNQNTKGEWQAPPTTQVAAQTCPPQTCPPPATETKIETTTVTAVSPCTGSTVTAYVTQWQNAPPGCWCGPPPTNLPAWNWGSGAGGAVAAPAFTASVSITPGLSSIPAAEAVKTGVTVAGPAGPPPAATATVSPGGFFGESSASAATSSGTETSSSSSIVSSNEAQPTKSDVASPPKASTSTTTTTTKSSSSSAPSSTTAVPAAALSSTTTSSSSASASSASAEAASSPAGDGNGIPFGAFNTIDPATLTLQNAYTLGIGRRAPAPTLLS